MSNNNDKKGIFNFFQRGQTHDDQHNPMATVVLAVTLIACLAGALLMVLGPKRAKKNATQLIQTVAENGLEQYIGTAPIINYYILKLNGDNIGYNVISWRIHNQPEKGLILEGHEFRFSMMYKTAPGTRPFFKNNYTIANDLSSYQYEAISTVRTETRHGMYEYHDSKGKIHKYQDGNIESNKYKIQTGENFIPEPLLDFFSALAIKENFSNGATFSIWSGGEFDDLNVKLGGQSPESLRQNYPDGICAKTQLLIPNFPVQELFYSQDNYLLWQKDILKPGLFQTMQISSLDEISDSFEGADTDIKAWQSQIEEKDQTSSGLLNSLKKMIKQ